MAASPQRQVIQRSLAARHAVQPLGASTHSPEPCPCPCPCCSAGRRVLLPVPSAHGCETRWLTFKRHKARRWLTRKRHEARLWLGLFCGRAAASCWDSWRRRQARTWLWCAASVNSRHILACARCNSSYSSSSSSSSRPGGVGWPCGCRRSFRPEPGAFSALAPGAAARQSAGSTGEHAVLEHAACVCGVQPAMAWFTWSACPNCCASSLSALVRACCTGPACVRLLRCNSIGGRGYAAATVVERIDRRHSQALYPGVCRLAGQVC